MMQAVRRTATALAAGAFLLLPLPSLAALPSGPVHLAAAASALRASADLGHGQKVSQAASAPGGPIVPEGCRNFGHWVSSEARGMTCEENHRPGRGADEERPEG
jgi:hypothetical protein